MNILEQMGNIQSGQLALIDVRPMADYGKAHVPGSIHAPYARNGWAPQVARWVARHDVAVALFADNSVVAAAAQTDLTKEGVTPAWVWGQGIAAWEAAGGPTAVIASITVDELQANHDQFVVVDVREPSEWRTGTVPGALRIPLGDLAKRLGELDRQRPYAVVCAHGNRSQSGASLLVDAGFQAGSVVGGMALWLGAGYPIERT